MQAVETLVIAGSSPRTRGTVQHELAVPPFNRFIPAHAGNSFGFQFDAGAAAVHPRARGEQVNEHGEYKYGTGSSPRTRGTAASLHEPAARRRFIPAHAGNR